MDAGWRHEEPLKPYEPAIVREGWSAQALAGDLLYPMVEKVNILRNAGLTVQMVVAEFIRRRLAPLQAHERALWDFSGRHDEMRLEDRRLSSESFNQLMSLLFGTVWETDLPAGVTPLYCQGAPWQHKDMPSFNEWGPIPAELEAAVEETKSSPSSSGAKATFGDPGEEGATEGVYTQRAAVALEACSSQDSMGGLFACDDVEVEVFRELEWDHSPR